MEVVEVSVEVVEASVEVVEASMEAFTFFQYINTNNAGDRATVAQTAWQSMDGWTV